MSARRVRFEVERFERVAAGPETVLLRVAGRWVSPRREQLSPPVLLVDDGRRIHRLRALPGPEDPTPVAGPEGPLWRAAFSAPAALLAGSQVAFALDAGERADLPRPTARAGASRGGPGPDTLRLRERLTAERARSAGAEAFAEVRLAELADELGHSIARRDALAAELEDEQARSRAAVEHAASVERELERLGAELPDRDLLVARLREELQASQQAAREEHRLRLAASGRAAAAQPPARPPARTLTPDTVVLLLVALVTVGAGAVLLGGLLGLSL